MNSADNITFEDPFEVSLAINGEQWQVTILPSHDHQKMESDFIVVIGEKIHGQASNANTTESLVLGIGLPKSLRD